jgi:hypothetical protein
LHFGTSAVTWSAACLSPSSTLAAFGISPTISSIDFAHAAAASALAPSWRLSASACFASASGFGVLRCAARLLLGLVGLLLGLVRLGVGLVDLVLELFDLGVAFVELLAGSDERRRGRRERAGLHTVV